MGWQTATLRYYTVLTSAKIVVVVLKFVNWESEMIPFFYARKLPDTGMGSEVRRENCLALISGEPNNIQHPPGWN